MVRVAREWSFVNGKLSAPTTFRAAPHSPGTACERRGALRLRRKVSGIDRLRFTIGRFSRRLGAIGPSNAPLLLRSGRDFWIGRIGDA
jgi:hypothetical protein